MKAERVAGVFLAAGRSSRMGRNKLNLKLGDTTIGSSSFHAAFHSNLDHIMVITQKEDRLGWMDPFFHQSSRWSQIECDEAEKGQAYSLRKGLQAAMDYRADAAVILLADQPFVQPAIINGLISLYKTALAAGEEAGSISSSFKGRQQPPLLFSKNLFPRLMELTGDIGARKILREMPKDRSLIIDYQDWRPFYDIDTEDDYIWIKTMER